MLFPTFLNSSKLAGFSASVLLPGDFFHGVLSVSDKVYILVQFVSSSPSISEFSPDCSKISLNLTRISLGGDQGIFASFF